MLRVVMVDTLNMNMNQHVHGNGNEAEHIQENNPADRNAALLHLENQYIQVLYDSLNDDERVRIAETDILRLANQIRIRNPNPNPIQSNKPILYSLHRNPQPP